MTDDQMLADLALRGWIATQDYLFKRLSETQVRVCMFSKHKTRYALTTIPYSYGEQSRGTQPPWSGGQLELRAAYMTAIEFEEGKRDDDA